MIKLYHGAILYCDSILRFKFEEFIHLHIVFYELSVFQSEAQICLKFSQIQPKQVNQWTAFKVQLVHVHELLNVQVIHAA